MSSFLIWFARL